MENRECALAAARGIGSPPIRWSGGDASAFWSATIGTPSGCWVVIRGDASCSPEKDDATEESIGLSSPERMVGMVMLSRERERLSCLLVFDLYAAAK